jgi:hypothetical protein
VPALTGVVVSALCAEFEPQARMALECMPNPVNAGWGDAVVVMIISISPIL